MTFHEFLKLESELIKRNKGDHIFHQGSPDDGLYFVQSGLLKAYYLSSEGKESIKSFLTTNSTIGSISSFYSGAECSFGLVCLENCVLRKIPFTKLQNQCSKDLKFANAIIEVLLQFAMKKEKREFEFLNLSAAQRYHLLVSESPELLDRVSQNDLARYLGLTPVGLSRIKNRR